MISHEYASFPDALDALAERIKSRRFSPDEYHIVLTPDRYTLRVEESLFRGGGAIDCEVLTLSRLASRTLTGVGALPREACVMLVRHAIDTVKDGLEYYGKAARYGDFAREVYDTLGQIASSGTSVSELKASGVTAEKLRDLERISVEYEKLKEGRRDAADRLKDLAEAVKDSALVGRSHFYAIGYKNATKLNRCVFDAIALKAKSFELYDAAPPALRKSMTVYEAPDAVTQYKAVAAEIRDYAYKHGAGSLDGVAVICPEPRALERILREYGIPFYSDSATALFDSPPLAALYDLYRMRGYFDTRTLVGFAKNPFSGCDRKDAERLQSEPSLGGVFDAEYADTLSSSARRALDGIYGALKTFRSGGAFSQSCRAVMEYCAFDEVASRLYDGETNPIEPINKLLALIDAYGGNCAETFDADADMFFSASRVSEVKSLPRHSDRVSVTMPSSLRLSRCKKLFIVDFNEGVLPQTTVDGGLLSDAEIAASGGEVEPTAREKNRRDREELAAVVSNAEDVFAAYSTAGGGRRAAFVAELTAQGGIYFRSYAADSALLKKSGDANFIARFACSPSAAREIAARRLSDKASSVAAAVGRCERIAEPFTPQVDLRRDTLSVSELTHWFSCPYMRFLTDSIGLKERREKLAAADFGLIVHEFMRRWIRSVPLDDSQEHVKKIVDSVLEETGYLSGERHKVDRERLVRNACDYAALNKKIIEAGNYTPVLAEKSFGGDLRLGKGDDVGFVGVIDRVDSCGTKMRIVDYKTGNKKFDLKKCKNGRDMQLPLYAAAVGAGNVTGIFYLPAGPVYDGSGAALSGCMIKDPDVALDYDRELASGVRSDVVAARLSVKNGAVAGFYRPGETLMQADDFRELVERCVETASVAADEINSGYIERAPIDDVCGYCAYRGLCAEKKPRCGEEEEESEE